MKSIPRPIGDPDGLSRGRRLLVGLLVLALLAGGAWLAALTVGRGSSPSSPTRTGTVSGDVPREADGRPIPSPSPPMAHPEPEREEPQVRRPPRTGDPVEFARAAADALWSYDARTASRRQRVEELRAWMTDEEAYADWESIASQIPSPRLWEGLERNGQYATADIDGGRFPAAFTQALRADPGAIGTAYVYVVTVTGRQTIHWEGGGGGSEQRAASLAVQCRPGRACALSGRLPEVAP